MTTTTTDSLQVEADRAKIEMQRANEALFRAASRAVYAHREQHYYRAADRLPEIGEVIEYHLRDSGRFGDKRHIVVTKITDKSILGIAFGEHNLEEYPEAKGRLSRTSGRYRTYLTVEEQAILEPLRREREEAVEAYRAANDKYFDAYQADADQAKRELRKARESAQLGFEPSEYYDAYPEVSIKIDGASGGYEVEISDWSVEDEDTRRMFTVPRSALIDIVARVIDASINHGEEEE